MVPVKTQPETDPSFVAHRDRVTASRPERVEKQREQRATRIKADVPNGFVGEHTNAGKSTLSQRTTEARPAAADQLSLHRHPMPWRIDVADVGETVLADTGGLSANCWRSGGGI